MGYHLAPGLSFCESDDQRLFLDIRRDRYFALGAAADRSFAKLTAGATLTREDAARLARLAAAGLLRPAEAAPPPSPCARPPAACRSLFAEHGGISQAAVAGAVARYAVARLRLRILGLGRALAALPPVCRSARPDPAADLSRIAGAFHAAARHATIRDHCLAHTLAVGTATRRAGLPTILVIGVHLRPFHAHSWLQHGDAVVNDSVDNVRDYAPILVLG